MDKQIFQNRAFLNKEGFHSNANIVTYIEEYDYNGKNEKKKVKEYYAGYKMMDCSEAISISIDLDDIKQLENTLFKLDKIIEITKEFRDSCESLRPMIEKKDKEMSEKT